jgi:hypothetical protein
MERGSQRHAAVAQLSELDLELEDEVAVLLVTDQPGVTP